MKQRRTKIIAWGLAGIVVVVSVFRVVLWAAGLNGAPTLFDLVEAFGWGLAIPSVFSVLAALIIARQPGNRVGWLMMIVGLELISPIDLMVPASAPAPPISLGLWLILWLQGWSWIPVIFPIFLIPLHFPTGRPLPGRWQWVTRAAVGMWLTFMVLSALLSRVGPSDESWTMANPIGFISADVANGPILAVWAAALVATVSTSVVSLFVRYRRSEGTARQQIRWLLMAGAVLVVAYMAFLVTAPENFQVGGLQNLTLVLSILGIPIAIAVAIFRYRLWDLEVVINRALVYGPLTTLLAGIFAMLVALTSVLAKQIFGTESQALGAALSAVVVAVIFQPMRTRVQSFVDSRFYPEKEDLASGLVEVLPEYWAFLNERKLLEIAQAHVRSALGVGFTELFEAGAGSAFIPWPDGRARGGDPDVLHLSSSQEDELHRKRVVANDGGGEAAGYVPIFIDRRKAIEVLGVLAIGDREDGRGFSGDDLKGLVELGGKIGLALNAIRLGEETAADQQGRLVNPTQGLAAAEMVE